MRMPIPFAQHESVLRQTEVAAFFRAGHDEVCVQGSSERIDHNIEMVVMG